MHIVYSENNIVIIILMCTVKELQLTRKAVPPSILLEAVD